MSAYTLMVGDAVTFWADYVRDDDNTTVVEQPPTVVPGWFWDNGLVATPTVALDKRSCHLVAVTPGSGTLHYNGGTTAWTTAVLVTVVAPPAAPSLHVVLRAVPG